MRAALGGVRRKGILYFLLVALIFFSIFWIYYYQHSRLEVISSAENTAQSEETLFKTSLNENVDSEKKDDSLVNKKSRSSRNSNKNTESSKNDVDLAPDDGGLIPAGLSPHNLPSLPSPTPLSPTSTAHTRSSDEIRKPLVPCYFLFTFAEDMSQESNPVLSIKEVSPLKGDYSAYTVSFSGEIFPGEYILTLKDTSDNIISQFSLVSTRVIVSDSRSSEEIINEEPIIEAFIPYSKNAQSIDITYNDEIVFSSPFSWRCSR